MIWYSLAGDVSRQYPVLMPRAPAAPFGMQQVLKKTGKRHSQGLRGHTGKWPVAVRMFEDRTAAAAATSACRRRKIGSTLLPRTACTWESLSRGPSSAAVTLLNACDDDSLHKVCRLVQLLCQFTELSKELESSLGLGTSMHLDNTGLHQDGYVITDAGVCSGEQHRQRLALQHRLHQHNSAA